jgi:tetratricopeptide (TPR) repeat protein/transcriptional regulator with XRE-family HTH domain
MLEEPTARDDDIADAAELGRVLKQLARRRPGGPVKVASLARRLNLSQSTLYAYLAGTTVPPSDVLDDLLGALGVPAGEHRRLSIARDALHRRRGVSQRPRVPYELPADTAGFTGRAAELAELDTGLSGGVGPAVRIASVAGPAGVGKTALAVHWCHGVAGSFPDGCLYSNLHGYSPADPRDPADVLAGFLRSLGVERDEVPDDPQECAARFRSLLAGRRMLILLDNALDADQIRLLLPGSPTCFVVITSRTDLAGLQVDPGTLRIDLRPLPEADGMALLRTHLGSKVDDAEDTARQLVDRCGGLPLALRVAAAQAIRHHAQPLDELVAELSGQGLDLLDVGDRTTAISTVFSWSLRHLSAQTATDFALLGSPPVRELDTAAIAALLGTDDRAAGRRVDQLVRAHLVQRSPGSRFGMHDLVRQYAGDRAGELPAEVREAAVGRLVDHLTERATWAMDLLHPGDQDPVAEPTAGQLGVARQWLDAEWHNLLAVIADAARRGRHEPTARLANVLRRHLDLGGRHSDALTVLGYALEASKLAGDRAAEGEALSSLGVAYLRLGRHDDAGAALRAAIAVCRECGDRYGEAAALNNLGNVHERLGRYREAMDHYEQALRLADALGTRQGKAILLTNLGVVHMRLTDYRQAVRESRQALIAFRALGDLGGAARNLSNLGEIRHLAGRPADAILRYDQALALAAEIGADGIETELLNRRGTAYLALGAVDRALADHEAALDIARAISDRYEEAKSLEWIGHAEFIAGRADVAAEWWRRSVAVYRQQGLPDADRVEKLLADR